jgi:HlyD family secretion protein
VETKHWYMMVKRWCCSRCFLLGAISSFVLLFIAFWLSGGADIFFSPSRNAKALLPLSPQKTSSVMQLSLPVYYEAVGTVLPRHEVTISAQVSGQVVSVVKNASEIVDPGEVIASLGDNEFRARLEKARSHLRGAQAALEQKTSQYERIKTLLEREVTTLVEMERAAADKSLAEAEVLALEQQVKEAEVMIGYTKILSPLYGIVAKKYIESGDLAWPGRPLFDVYDPKDLRLEANIREGLIGDVTNGMRVEVYMTSLDAPLDAIIDEIIPSADPKSRSFLVKVSLPDTKGVYPGMFGMLKIVIGEREALLVPQGAVSTVGQLDTVLVKKDDRWERIYVTKGKRNGEYCEVLSGLSGGEIVGYSIKGKE